MGRGCYKSYSDYCKHTMYVCSWTMGSPQFVKVGRLHTQACGMETILLKSAPMGIKDLAVLAITGLLVKKPYFIPYACYQLVITCWIWPLLIAYVSLLNHVMCFWNVKVKTRVFCLNIVA